MNDWKKVFDAIDAIHADVSKLLVEADKMLAIEGYKPIFRNNVGGEGSKHVDWPSWWIPGWFSRHYRLAKDLSRPKVFVAVLLRDRASDDLRGLDEPVVTAGILQTATQAHWTAKAWAWTKRRDTNGEWELCNFSEKSGGGSADVFALPLASITSASLLEKLVIRPLVERAAELSC